MNKMNISTPTNTHKMNLRKNALLDILFILKKVAISMKAVDKINWQTRQRLKKDFRRIQRAGQAE